MSIDILKKDLKEENFKSIYYFYGNEEYLKSYYLKRLQNKILDDIDEFNLHTFEGKGLELSLLADTLESYPLMSEKKMVIINDLPFSRIQYDKKSEAMGDVREFLEGFVKDFPPYSTLVIHQVIEKNSDNEAKLIASMGSIATIVKFETPKEAELVDWVSRHISHHKHSMDNATIRYMLSLCDNNMTSLKNEIDKLCAYAVTPEITKKHIDEIITKTLDAMIFDLSNAISAGNFSRAYTVLGELYFQKNVDIVIAATMYKAFTNLYKIKVGVMSGKQAIALSKELKMNEYAVKKNMELCRNLSQDYLRKCIYLFEKVDIELRSNYSANKRAIIERLIGEMLNLEQKDKG